MIDPSDTIFRNIINFSGSSNKEAEEELSINELFDQFERSEIDKDQLLAELNDREKTRLGLAGSFFKVITRS